MKSQYKFLIFLFAFVISTFAVQTQGIASSQTGNDIVITRSSYVLRFINGGPDVTFYNIIDANDSQSRYRYSIQWNSLTEYKDTNNNGIYDNGSDTKVSTLNINTLVFTAQKVSYLETQNGKPINTTNLEFNSTFTQNGQKGNLSIIYSWWNTTFIVHPYGSAGNSITLNTNQSKYSFVISGWNFHSPQNRLALDATIHTSVGLSSYNVLLYKNNTVSMITKTNPDGKGFRGGIINSPAQAYSDNQLSQTNVSIRQSGINLFMEYDFQAFTTALLYDPTYSAVTSMTAPTPGSGASTLGSSPIPGFTYEPLLLGFFIMVPIILVKRKYFH